MSIYKKTPTKTLGRIPIFCSEDFYTQNYEIISKDHLEGLRKHGKNPFMPEELVNELESKTCNIIKKFMQKGKLLDAGVGYGGLLSKLQDFERYGVDISMAYLESLPAEINGCFAKLEELPYNDEFFDGVICTDVLEHVLDLNKVIQEIARVTKPNGLIFARVPYKESLSGYLETTNPYNFVHLRSFCKEELILLFTKIFDFKTLYIEKMGFLKDFTRSETYISKICELSNFDSLLEIPSKNFKFFATKNNYFSKIKTMQLQINQMTEKIFKKTLALNSEISNQILKDLLVPTEILIILQKKDAQKNEGQLRS